MANRGIKSEIIYNFLQEVNISKRQTNRGSRYFTKDTQIKWLGHIYVDVQKHYNQRNVHLNSFFTHFQTLKNEIIPSVAEDTHKEKTVDS